MNFWEDNTFDGYGEFTGILSPVDIYIHGGADKSIKELFIERLETYDIKQSQAEKIMGVQTRTLEGILDKSAVRVDAVNLIKLAQFLGITYKHFIDIYTDELPVETIKEIETTRRNVFLISHFDIKTLRKAGFLKKKSDFDEIEARIVKFFNLKSIYDYAEKSYSPAFSFTKRSPHFLMRDFWVASAKSQFEIINNPNPYSKEVLLDLIPKIRPYTMNEKGGLKIVMQALYNAGVTVIYQPHLTTTQVRGATFILGGKPCIALTDLNKNYATIWFALIHELHHVLFEYDDIQKQVYHLTGELDLFLIQEEAANKFARDYLFSEEKTKYILPHIDNHYLVEQYAKECQIHPSIIYSFYTYDMDKKNIGSYYWKFQDYFPDVKKSLTDIQNVDPFTDETIEEIGESVKYLKENVYNI